MFLWLQDISSFQHYKLTLHRTVAHVGEVSWQQYSQSLSKSLVNTKQYKTTLIIIHSLTPGSTTRILYSDWLISQRTRKMITLTLAITSARVRNSGSHSTMETQIFHVVGMLAKEQVVNMMPSPPKQEPLNTPNVLLIYSQKV